MIFGNVVLIFKHAIFLAEFYSVIALGLALGLAFLSSTESGEYYCNPPLILYYK